MTLYKPDGETTAIKASTGVPEDNSLVTIRISEIVNSSRNRAERLVDLLALVNEVTDNMDIEATKMLVNTVLSDQFSLGMFYRPIICAVVNALENLPIHFQKHICPFLLDKLSSRAVTFESENDLLRKLLAACHENDSRPLEAANCLADGSWVAVTNTTRESRIQELVRISELYLQADELAAAEATCGRIGTTAESASCSPELNYRHLLVLAKILTLRAKYTEATKRFYDLSTHPFTNEPSQRIEMLVNAAKCAILSPAGSQTSDLLKKLIRDSRIQEFPLRDVISRVDAKRFLRRTHLNSLADLFATGNGFLVIPPPQYLVKALVQHNVISASKVFASITWTTIARLIDVEADVVEDAVADMIYQNRLNAKIDQEKGLVYFTETCAKLQNLWSLQVANLLTQVEQAYQTFGQTESRLSS